MKSFQFPLDKVLDLRRKQLELEEAHYKRQMASIAAIDRRRAEIEADGIRAEVEVREWRPISSGDLVALGAYRLKVKAGEADLARRRMDAQKKLADQQKLMLDARRRCRLLERLRERRLGEWTVARDKELDEIAAESFLATWARRDSAADGG
ncbi:MAG: hypothetical protein ABI759_31995 [Candidatus Solibacter sp.]